ncbi:DUF6233 domain-containing protein [Streptomyces sp. PmtG]
MQLKRTATGPVSAMIHSDDCSMIEGRSHPITDHDARAALTDPNVQACAFCRPESDLGMDVA